MDLKSVMSQMILKSRPIGAYRTKMKAHNKILSLLETKQKREAIALLSLSIVMSFFEVVGIASLFPFMSVLAAPEPYRQTLF